MADQSLRVVRVQVPVIDVWLGLDFGGGKSHCLLWYKYQSVYTQQYYCILCFQNLITDFLTFDLQNINICHANYAHVCNEMQTHNEFPRCL